MRGWPLTVWLGALASAACGTSAGSPSPDGCDAGWTDCDGDPANGCEIRVDRDESHCGACGVVCSDAQAHATCVDGVCEQECFVGWADCDGDATNGCETEAFGDDTPCEDTTCPSLVEEEQDACVPTLLFEGLEDSTYTWLLLDGARLYLAGAGDYDPETGPAFQPEVGALHVIDLDTAEVSTLLADEWVPSLVLVGGQLVWPSPEGEIVRMPATGGAITTITTGLEPGIRGLERHDGWLYVGAASANDTLSRVPVDGGAPQVLLAAQGLGQVAFEVDDSGVYVGTGQEGSVLRLSHDGSSVEPVAEGLPRLLSLAVDETSVWVGDDEGGVHRIDKVTGAVETWTIAEGDAITLDIHLAPPDIYLASPDIWRLPHDAAPGTPPERIVEGTFGWSMASDAERLFWLEPRQGGWRVMVLAR